MRYRQGDHAAGPAGIPHHLRGNRGRAGRGDPFFRQIQDVYDENWEVSYTGPEYIRLLDTFSGHISMDAAKRERRYGEIRRRLAERPDGRLRRHWGAVLQVARRTER
jgi:hypothetical protein